MAITQNAARVRVESAAKDGTLGVQSTSTAVNLVVFDTAITTNNGNLDATPSFRRRHVVLRAGSSDEECGMIQSVSTDDVTCQVYEDWVSAPSSGDSYSVAYRLEDLETVAGCDFETDSRQWNMTKRLIVGTATLPGYFGMSHGQVLRLQDSSSTGTSAMRVGGLGRLEIGTIKNERSERGAHLMFDQNADDELVMDWISPSVGRLYEFSLTAARGHEGVTGLEVTIAAGSSVVWGRAQLHGMDAPFKKRVNKFQSVLSVDYGTKEDIMASPMWSGYLKSEADQTIFDTLTSESTVAKVRLLFEDA